MSERYKIMLIPPEEWARRFSNNVHVTVFGEYRPGYMDRISYALLVIDLELDIPVAYLTAREVDAESIYWSHGGGIPPNYKPSEVLRIYKELVSWHSDKYKRISTFTKNDNLEYLRIALKCGFRIIGTKYFNNEILVELLNSFDTEA